MYDCLVIGGGVVGCAVARELSRYKLKGILLEKEIELCSGTSKANSGIIHGGYDASPNTLKAKLNVAGAKNMENLSKELDFNYENCGSFVICKREEDFLKLEELFYKGKANGVEDLEIIMDKDRIYEMEPNLREDIYACLYAKNAGIVCPFELNIALGENAEANGFEFSLDTEVKSIEKKEDYFVVKTNKGIFEARIVINAAGVYADEIHNMVSEEKAKIILRKGEYYLLDREAKGTVNRTIFPLPDEFGKGILIAPTVDGNVIVGPNAYDIFEKDNVDTTREGLIEVSTKAKRTVKDLPLDKVITTFSGLRAHGTGDFVIGEVSDSLGFYDCLGIESPGLTSCHEIGKMIAKMIEEKYGFSEKEDFNPKRKGITKIENLSDEEYRELIGKDPTYGNIICRCETISEGQIKEACKGKLGAKTLDGVKRRIRPGAGRCQGGFCSPKVMEIIAREKNIPLEEITKKGKSSKLIYGKTK